MVVAATMMALVALATASLTPRYSAPPAAPDLGAFMPAAFDDWRAVEVSGAVLPPEIEPGPGEATIYRAYKNSLGNYVTIVIAYGPPMGDSVRLHRPEKCYVAQGFEITARRAVALRLDDRSIPLVMLETRNASRREAVSYLLRDGRNFTTGEGAASWRRLIDRQPGIDGALLRVSSLYGDKPPFALQQAFLTNFLDALSPDGRALLIGEGARE